jgi:hypothetical protein
MPMIRTVNSKGFALQLLMTEEGHVEILHSDDAPMDDPGYKASCEHISKFFEYFECIYAVQVFGAEWQQKGVYDPLYSECYEIAYVIRAFETGAVKFPEEIYRLAVAIRDRVSPTTYSNKIKKSGYVYLIQSVTGHHKIGRSVNPHNRLKTFGVLLPFEIEYIALIKSDDHIGLERYLHDKFASQRVNGEWFNLDPEDVEYFKALAAGVSYG